MHRLKYASVMKNRYDWGLVQRKNSQLNTEQKYNQIHVMQCKMLISSFQRHVNNNLDTVRISYQC